MDADAPDVTADVGTTDTMHEVAPCPPGTKSCGGQCVSVDDPAFGCSLTGCAPCALSRATATCSPDGSCVIASCESDWADCDASAANGCEANVQSDPNHCSACDKSCGAGRCVVGVCDLDPQATDFSEYALGVQPSDWTSRWMGGSATWIVESGAGLGSQELHCTSSFEGRNLLTWDAIPSDTTDVELLAKVMTQQNTGSQSASIMVRASGGAGLETGYVVGFICANDELQLAAYSGGQFDSGIPNATRPFPCQPATWYWIRFRASGSQLSVRAWPDGVSESGTWEINVTDTSISTGGWVGVRVFYPQDSPSYDYFAVGVDGDFAPAP